MKKTDYTALLAMPALMLATSLQAGSFEGYLIDSEGAIVKTPYGECIHTGFWNKEYAQPECDETLEIRSKYAVAVEKAEQAGLPKPAKPPEIVAMEQQEAPMAEPVVEEVPMTATVEVGNVESADSEGSKVSEIEVGDGDSLWVISAKDEVYGNAELWPLLLCANKEQIVDADLIYAGQMLTVSQSSTADQVAAAMTHANQRGHWELGEVEDSDMEYLAIHCSR